MFGQNITPLNSYRKSFREWAPQDLAEFYRVESALLHAGIHVYTDSGITDEGDPWFIFCREVDNEIVVHIAHIDGFYIIASAAYIGVAKGKDLRAMVKDLLERHKLSTSGLGGKNSNVFMHPSALLILVIGAAFFKTPSKAEAADISEKNESTAVTQKTHVAGVSSASKATAVAISSLFADSGLGQSIAQQNIAEQTLQIAAAITIAAASVSVASAAEGTQVGVGLPTVDEIYASSSQTNQITAQNVTLGIMPYDLHDTATLVAGLSQSLSLVQEIVPALNNIAAYDSGLTPIQRVAEFTTHAPVTPALDVNIYQLPSQTNGSTLTSAKAVVPSVDLMSAGHDTQGTLHDTTTPATTTLTKSTIAATQATPAAAQANPIAIVEASQDKFLFLTEQSGYAAQLVLKNAELLSSNKVTVSDTALPSDAIPMSPPGDSKTAAATQNTYTTTGDAAVTPSVALTGSSSATIPVSSSSQFTTSAENASHSMLFMTEAVDHNTLSVSETSFIQTLNNFIAQAPSVKVYNTTNSGLVFYDQAAAAQQGSGNDSINVMFSDGSSISIIGQSSVIHQLIEHI